MKIEYKNYVIEQSRSDRFNLQEKVTRTKKNTNEQYERLLDLAYDIKLEYAIELVVNEELRKLNKVVTLKEFLKEYKREKDELLKVTKI